MDKIVQLKVVVEQLEQNVEASGHLWEEWRNNQMGILRQEVRQGEDMYIKKD